MPESQATSDMRSRAVRFGGLRDEKIVRCRWIFSRGGRVIEIKKARQAGTRKGKQPGCRRLKTLWVIGVPNRKIGIS
jgi:hypothetical protein